MSVLEGLLPTPSPDDDEDVVWGLSTASALWARGERRDAIVWLRRATEAAAGAGQASRAAELDIAISALERAITVPAPRPSGSVDGDVEADGEETVASEGPAVRAAVDRALRRAAAEAAPSSRRPAPAAVHIPMPASRASTRPAAPTHASSAPPPAFSTAPSIPTPVAASPSPSPTPPAVAPSAAPSKPPPVAPSAPPPAALAVAAVVVPSPVPVLPQSPAAPVVAARPQPAPAPAPAASTRVARQRPRSPILDPWAGPPATLPLEPLAASAALGVSSEIDDEDVITSAVPLSVATRRRGKPVKAGLTVPIEAAPAPAPAPQPDPGVEIATPVLAEPLVLDPLPGADEAFPVTDDPPTPPRALSRPIPAPSPSNTVTEGGPVASIGGLSLGAVPLLAGVPFEVQEELVAGARLERLAPHAEIEGFGAVLILEGGAALSAAIVPAPIQRLAPGGLVPSRGTLAQGVPLRITAADEGAQVALWTTSTFGAALAWCPWVLDELERVANRLQALAGASMGPLGDLDEAVRARVVERLQVRVARAGEVVAEKGAPLTGTTILGAGLLDIEGRGEVHPGDVLFPRAASTGAPAPATARAGLGGALLLVGEPGLLAELSASVPALADLLGG